MLHVTPNGKDAGLKRKALSVVVDDRELFTAPATQKVRRAKAWLNGAIEQGMRTPHGTTGKLTPELAELLIADGTNAENRKLNEAWSSHLAGIIKRGDWKLNGESIIISKCGKLNDGQHRCRAVVLAGVPVETFFAFGVERDSRKTVDTGKKRSISHVFQMQKYPNAATMATAARVAFLYAQGTIVKAPPADVGEVERYYLDNTDMQLSMSPARNVYSRIGGSISIMTAAHFIMSQVAPLAADEFFDILATAKGALGGPIMKLRRIYLSAQRDNSHKTERDALADLLKTWNVWRGKSRGAGVVWVPGEPYPVAV